MRKHGDHGSFVLGKFQRFSGHTFSNAFSFAHDTLRSISSTAGFLASTVSRSLLSSPNISEIPTRAYRVFPTRRLQRDHILVNK
jgi:hypothetical protein